MAKDIDIGRFADKWFGDIPKLINIVAQIVTKDIEKGITISKDVRNKPFKRLKSATIKAKQRKGSAHPSRPLEDTGAMKKVYIKQYASKSKPKAIITMPKRIGDVGVFHNLGGTTVKGKPPLREWFNISPRADKKIDKYIEQWVISH